MKEKMSLKRDSSYIDWEADKLALVRAHSRIKKLKNEVALSRIQIDRCEKEKHDLIAVIKKQHDKFIHNRLDSLMGQIDSKVSLLNEIIATMKRTDYPYDLISLCCDDDDDDGNIVDEQNPAINEPKGEDDGLTSIATGPSSSRVSEYTQIRKLGTSHIGDVDDPLRIDDVKCQEVLTLSDDESDRSDFRSQSVSRPTIPSIVLLDDSSIESISDNYYLILSEDSDEAPHSKNNLQLQSTSFLNSFQKATLPSGATSTKKERP